MDFTDGLNPVINEQNVQVSTAGTVVVSNGYATLTRGEIRLTPPVAYTNGVIYHIKFMITTQKTQTELFNDAVGNLSAAGIAIEVGSSSSHCFVSRWWGSFSNRNTIRFPNNFATNTEYDLVVEIKPTEFTVYLDDTLVGTVSISQIVSPYASYAYIGRNNSGDTGFTGRILLFEETVL